MGENANIALMKTHNLLKNLCILLVFALAACENLGQNGLPFTPAGPHSAPSPMDAGPFGVGVKTLVLVDASRLDPDSGKPRTLKTEIWYPAGQDAKDGPFWSYNVKDEVTPELLGEEKYDSFMSADLPLVPTFTVRDANVDRDHGPYPVIVYSHGSNSIRWQSIFYTAHLASHGYIVLAPDHEGNTLWDLIRDGFDQASVVTSSYKRLDDVGFILDSFLEKSQDPEDFFFGVLDRTSVGITGHSFGGFTSVAMPCADERFKVAVAQAPVISLTVGWCNLNSYPVPLMVQGGDMDKTVPFKDQYCDLRSMGGDDPMHLVKIYGGGHFTFADLCQLDLLSLSQILDLGGVVEEALADGCGPDNIEPVVAHPLINHYATAMFNVYLRGSESSLEYISEQPDPMFDSVELMKPPLQDWPQGGCL